MSQILVTDPGPIDGILQIQSKDIEICIRKNRRLFGYQYQNSKWKKNWEVLIFENDGEYPVEKYPWIISDKLLPDTNILAILHPDGIRLYQINPDKSGLTLLKEDDNFHEVFDLTVVFGNFYPGRHWLGVVSRNKRGEVKFYAATEDSFDEETADPLFLLNEVNLSPEWRSNEFFVEKLRNDDRDVIGLRTATGLEFFEFDEDYQLNSVVKTEFGRKVNDDAVFFANVTGGKLKDIVVVNQKGLHVYRYDKKYELWNLDNGRIWPKNVKFADLNGDGRDDLIFTGRNGLTVVTFDGDKWIELTGSDVRTYGKVVGVMEASSGPSLFIEDAKGLRWSSGKYSPVETTTTTTTMSTTTGRVTTARYQDVRLQEIERKKYTVKRWAEHLDSNFLKESVNTNNGHVGLSIPLVDVSSSTGWKIQLSLSYSSQPQNSEILGIGWYLPIAQDYVFVDCQGSIFGNDAVYYLIMQGSLYRLRLKSRKGDVTTYRMAEDMETDIEYHRGKEQWVIRGTTEDVTFGTAGDSMAKDALAYGLTWANWRLSGSDRTGLKRMTTSWYLNRRFDKNTERSLYYHYDKDDGMKGYTLSMRLKTITDGDSKVTFNYGDRTPQEYTIDDEVNLPMPQVHTKYLTSVISDTYRINFGYEVLDGKRLLKRINDGTETVFEFNYDKFKLKNCKLIPHQISVYYDYGSYIRPSFASIFGNVITYPVKDKPKIACGSDYSVLGYVDGGLRLQILNQYMTHVKKEVVIGGEVKDYVVEAYDDAFMVLIITEDRKLLHVYTREKKKWSDNSVSYSFGKNDEVRYGKNIIAVARSSSVELYAREDGKADWKMTSFPISRSMVYFANYQKLIVGYDDSQLVLFHLDEDFKWRRKILGDYSNFEKNSKNVVDSFDLTEEFRKNLKSNLNNLQIFNNFITLYELRDNSGRLYVNVHLFLLNDEYEIGTSRTFTINRENVYDKSHELESDNKKYTYKIGYARENGVYKIKVKDVYGEGIRSIKNRNHRYDAVESMKKGMNNDEDFKKSARENIFLLDWSLYQVQMTQNGVVIGDELLGLTGVDWERKPNPKHQKLGKVFKLEASSDNKKFKLLKNGGVVKEMELFEANQIMNRYPGYLAYYPKKDTIRVVNFKDDDDVGEEHVFNDEKGLPVESSSQNFLTIRDGQLLIRPADVLQEPKPELFVRKMMIRTGEVERVTAYRHGLDVDKRDKKYSEIVTVIPGADEKSHGRYELVETYDGEKKNSERYFDSNNAEVFKPEVKIPAGDKNKPKEDDTLLLDRSKKLLISDFSPYGLKDDMCGYFGFESYEKNYDWIFDKSYVRKKFAFTGENYLEINKSSKLERKFTPVDQDLTYLASCWIRSSGPLKIDDSIPYLKALVIADNNEIIGLNAKVKLKSDDWYYLELPIDFQVLKKIHEEYVKYNKIKDGAKKLSIILQVKTSFSEKIDLDHVRFTPLTFDFQATVYHPIIGKAVAILQSNGLVTRTLYNRKQEELATIQEDGNLTRLTSINKFGNLVPAHSKKNSARPNVLIFEPEQGMYEGFSKASFLKNWDVEDDVWMVSPGQLWHTEGKHKIKAKSFLFDAESSAVRLHYDLDFNSSIVMIWEGIKMELTRRDNVLNLKLLNGDAINSLPVQAEIIIMAEKNYFWVWLDGLLLFDGVLSREISWSSFALEISGKVLMEDLVIMKRPKLKVEYYNALDEKIQTIEMEDVNTVKVTEVLYDELGREAITTKTSRIKRNKSLLNYRDDFVVNKIPTHSGSVFKTGIIKGLVDDLNKEDGGYPYTRTEYAKNPLGENKAFGLPGKEFSVSGAYSAKFSTYSDVAFLDLLFPVKNNYRQKVEYIQNGSYRVSVYDANELEIARYVRVPSYDHLLSTYDYDDDGNLIKILPPAYHENAGTYSMLTPWSERTILPDLEEKFGTFFTYDKNGNLVRKKTPDDGVTQYLYNSNGLIRFMVSLGKINRSNRIVYYNYDGNGQLVTTGTLDRLLPLDMLMGLVESDSLPYAEEHQEFDYSDDHLNPLLRGRTKHCVTYNDELVVEKLKYNDYDQVVSKTSTILQENEENIELKIDRVNGKVRSMTYPVHVNGQVFVLNYRYNKLGQLVGLGSGNRNYVKFSYHPTGELAAEEYEDFARRYQYNSPGFLKQISDPFLTEDVEYTDHGYGQKGFGDGMVMRTVFKTHWTDDADYRWFQIQDGELEKTCLQALKQSGYVNQNNQPVKLFNVELSDKIPLVCRERGMAEIIAQKHTPEYYGHSYAYGNHQELIKAKYFTSDTVEDIKPLTYDSFMKIKGLHGELSKDIWRLLEKERYLYIDKTRKNEFGIGKRGKSFLRGNLYHDLEVLNGNYVLFARPIEKLILKAASEGKRVTLEMFESAFLAWQGVESASFLLKNYHAETAKEIGNMLKNKKYIETDVTDVIDDKFKDLLRKYKEYLGDILKVLHQHFAYQLGETPFDVESYNIDGNGNHKLFYTGFDRYEFIYKNFTNQIEGVKLNNEIYAMEYDEQGNVIKATHKGISQIKYYSASQRPSLIRMNDGRTLRFSYDAQGERILKRVFGPDGKLVTEIRYLRDEQGRVLVDRKITPGATDVITVYLYGPRGLVGFMRDNKFYSVMTDHAGSVRLVVQDGRVVAAYDYLPYGQISREYGSDHITYRYTGQEWDEETGLYNYHARLYDPTIGRFYQIDPKSQYFSPYVYAGNSPLSTIDPDGEFASLLTCLILGVVGAYLGGAAANNRWNPVDWDWKDPRTYLGIFGGAVAGGLMPIGAAASVGAIGIYATAGLGLGGGYLFTAAANQNWDPTKWAWDRPSTWNGLFQGFGAGSGIAGGVGMAHKFAKDIATCAKMCTFLTKVSTLFGVSTKTMKTVFLTVSYGTGAGVAYAHGVVANEGNFAIWQWDFTNPNTWSSLIDGFDVGMGWPQNFLEIGRGIGKLSKNHKAIKDLLRSNPSKRALLKGILKNTKNPLSKVAGSILMGYFMGASATGELDITKWSLSEFSTYEGILNGVFFGKDTQNMLKYARDSNKKDPMTFKPKSKKWTKKFSDLMGNILKLREKMFYKRALSDLFTNPKKVFAPEIEKFLKNGLEKSNKPPEELKKLINEEIKQKMEQTSKDVKKWRDDANDLNREKNEIYPDRDVEYLNCRKLRRKKRSGGPSGSCSVPISNEIITKKKELVQHFLNIDERLPSSSEFVVMKPNYSGAAEVPPRNIHQINPNEPKGFAENLSLIVESTPNVLAATKPDFFINTVLGSILTLGNSKNGKLTAARKQTIFAKQYNANFVPPRFGGFEIKGFMEMQSTPILKTGWMTKDSNGNNVMVLKTFVVEPRANINEHLLDNFFSVIKQQLEIKSKYSPDELSDLSKRFGVRDGDYSIEENIFYIKNDNTLEVKRQLMGGEDYVRDHTTKVEGYLNLLKDKNLPDKRGRDMNHFLSDFVKQMKFGENLKFDQTGVQDIARKVTKVDAQFKEVGQIRGKNLDKFMESIKKNNVKEIKESMEGLLDDLLTIYHKNKAAFGFNPNSESGFHAFVYGALTMNFKRLYGLDIRVEAISGRGYADLMFICRLDSKDFINWNAIPIVVEFKADKTGSKGASDQIKNTGYLYNLGLKTLAEKAVIVGVNSNAPPPAVKTAENSPFEIKIVDIPKPEGFVKQSVNNPDGENVIKEMKHLYYSISPLAFKTKSSKNNQYFSRLVLGELLSKNGMEVHVLNHKNTDAHGKLTTFVYKDNNQWVMLNFVESSKKGKKSDLYEYDGINIDNYVKLPKDLKIDDFVRIDIETNSKSNIGWSLKEIKRSDIKNVKLEQSDFFFQGVDVKKYNSPIATGDGYTKLNSINVDEAYLKDIKSTVRTEKILQDLSETLKKIPADIQSESDFQAVLQGILLHKKFENGIVKVFVEANPSKAGRIDIALIELETGVDGRAFERSVQLMELKFANGANDVKVKLEEAKEQVLKYNINLKILTDSPTFEPIAAVYDFETGKITYEKLDPQIIRDSTQILSDVSSESSDGRMSVDEVDMDVDDLVPGLRRMRSESDAVAEGVRSGDSSSDCVDDLIPALKRMRTERGKRSVVDEPLPWLNLIWNGLHQFMERIAFSQDSSPVNNSFAVTEYSHGHFQGLLQLLDLGVRKLTGAKHIQQVTSDNISWAEASVKAGELTDDFYESLKSTIKLSDFDDFALRKRVAGKLFSGELQDIPKIFESEIRKLYNSVVDRVGKENGDEFLKSVEKFEADKSGVRNFENFSFGDNAQIYRVNENLLGNKIYYNNSLINQELPFLP